MLNNILNFYTTLKKNDNPKIIFDTDDKLPDDVTLQNVVISLTCIIKDDGKFYRQIFLEEVLAAEKSSIKKEDTIKKVDKNI